MSMLFLSSATVSDINNKNKLTIVFAMPSFKYYKWIDKNVLIVEFSEKICESLTLVAYYLLTESEFHDCFGRYTSHNLY